MTTHHRSEAVQTSAASTLATEDNRVAFERQLPHLRALPAEGLMAITVDCVGAAQRVLGCLPKIRGVLVPSGTTCPDGFDAMHFDQLEELARTLLWSQYAYNGADVPVEAVEEMVGEITAIRELLVADASALAKRKVISTRVLDSLKGGPGYRNLLDDTMSLVAQLGQHEAEVIAHSGIRAGELDRIRLVGSKLDAALGRRAELPKVAGAAADIRLRAYTSLWRAYDEVRRAVGYLRYHHEDADDIAPSLFAGRAHAKGNNGADVAPTPEPVTPAAPVPAAPPVAAGMPGGDPFTTH
jgi:hypothetical protein